MLFFVESSFSFIVGAFDAVIYIIFLLNHTSLFRMKMELKSSTGFGTPSDQNWLLPFLVVLMMFGL
jgi:hypothetical protein